MAQPLHLVAQTLRIIVLVLVDVLDLGRPFGKVDLVAVAHAKILGVYLHDGLQAAGSSSPLTTG